MDPVGGGKDATPEVGVAVTQPARYSGVAQALSLSSPLRVVVRSSDLLLLLSSSCAACEGVFH